MYGELRPERRLLGLITSVGAAAAVIAAGTGQALAAPAGSSPAASTVSVTAALRSALTGLYATHRGIPRRDIAALTSATVQEAYQSPAHTWWAVARFQPARHDSLAVGTGFQDGAGTVVFTRHDGGHWRITQVAGSRSLDCWGMLPASVQQAWHLTDTAACAPSAKTGKHVRYVKPSTPDPGTIASIAADNIGVADNPASTNFGFDCDPYTTLVGNTWVSSSGCGVDSRFNVQNRNEEWCADFAKYVWEQGGVTADTSTLTAAASSFYAWGQQQHESMPTDPSYPPAPGDAVVFYGPGEAPGTAAAHVGIVVSVNSDGTINMANGDFAGSSNISVQGNNNVSLGPWSASIWGSGTQWVYVSPGSASVVSAFQANTGFLWTDADGHAGSTALGMMTGTSPAIATSGGGTEIAFQANTGYLWTDTNGHGTDTTLGMMPGTSPAITALPSGGYEIAFQANTGDLWLIAPNGTATDEHLGMLSGTSPAIAAAPGGGFDVAFQANTGQLWTDTGGGHGTSQELGMAPGTSPAITAWPAGGYQIALQANTGYLWTDTNGTGTDTTLGMLTGTSPAITTTGSATTIAFQANTGYLWTDTGGNAGSTALGMAAGTSPAIASTGSGTAIAFQANTGYLWTDINGTATDTALGLMNNTNPTITG